MKKHGYEQLLFGLEHTGHYSTLAVMEEFESVGELVGIPLDELIEFLVLHGKNRFDDPEAVARALKKAARSSYRLPDSMADSINLAMASSIRIIRVVQEQFLKRLTQLLELVQYTHLAFWPKSISRNLKTSNSWQNTADWHGTRINPVILLPNEPG